MTMIERFNNAVETADKHLRWKQDRDAPEQLFVSLCWHGWHREARELLEAGRPLGYFRSWQEAIFKSE